MDRSNRHPREASTTMRRLQHEMRTPLSHILGYSQMLTEELRDRDQADLIPDLERIEGAARDLLEQVETVFLANESLARSPVVRRLAGDALPQGQPRGPPTDAGGSLLVVDDEPNNRDLLARRLERRGYRVTVADGGREALRLIEQESFDLVVLDVMMPGLDGLEVLDSIRRTKTPTQLPVLMASVMAEREKVIEALRRGANDYVTKPLDFPVVFARVEAQLAALRGARELEEIARQLEIRNAFIRRVLGRYVSEEVATQVLEDPDSFELRGEKRTVTILMSDLRGFTALTAALPPQHVVSVLNNYLGTMTNVIQSYGGTLDEIIGDGILSLFGAPLSADDDVERAVACAVAMQRAMEEVNAKSRRMGLPDVEMGIGVSTGEVVVGNVGSELRTRYGAVGAAVNEAARIESYTAPGEILVSEAVRAAVPHILDVGEPRVVQPKGVEGPMRIYPVRRIGGIHQLSLPERKEELTPLAETQMLRFSVLDGKDVGAKLEEGEIIAISFTGARVRAAAEVRESMDLRCELLDAAGTPIEGAFYAKVVEVPASAGEGFRLRFTTRSAPLTEFLARVLEIPSGSAGEV